MTRTAATCSEFEAAREKAVEARARSTQRSKIGLGLESRGKRKSLPQMDHHHLLPRLSPEWPRSCLFIRTSQAVFLSRSWPNAELPTHL